MWTITERQFEAIKAEARSAYNRENAKHGRDSAERVKSAMKAKSL